MDDLDLLRSYRPHPGLRPGTTEHGTTDHGTSHNGVPGGSGPSDDDVLARARARLMTVIAAPSGTTRTAPSGTTRTAPPGRSPVPRIPRRSLVTVAVAAVVVTLGVTAVVTLHPGDRGAAQAADVLDRAADATLDAAPPTLAPGTFLRVEEREEAMGYVTDDGSTMIGAYIDPLVTTTWIPADQADTWVSEEQHAPVTTVYGGAAGRRAAERIDGIDQPVAPPSITRAKGGRFGNGELGGTPAGMITTDDIATLPRDPQRLRTRLADAPGDSGATPSGRVMDQITELLRSGLVPADLQSTMYRTLGLLPGIRVVHDRALLDGRTGTAFGLIGDGTHDREEIVVDATTGTYIGQREVQVERVGPVPAGTVSDSTSVRISVVDRTP